MVVKDKIGRRRYIIARGEKKIHPLMKEIKKIDKRSKIVFENDNFTVIFCRHWYKDKIIDFLKSQNIETYYTTGTIKKAKKIIKTL